MEKANITVLESGREFSQNQTLEVMFNPGEYTTSTLAQWHQGRDISRPQFQGSKEENLTIELFFDSYESRQDVRKDRVETTSGRQIAGTHTLARLAIPQVEGKEVVRPPICRFSWGKFTFKGVVEKVSQKFTMFLSTGIPVRARVTITMRPVITPRKSLELKGVSDSRKVRQVREGDRLDLIAAEELQDPALWKEIAKANDIADPLVFPRPQDIGEMLIIPEV